MWTFLQLFLFQDLTSVHPYHVDSLLQLSEICKMSEDLQMAAELIGEFPWWWIILVVFVAETKNITNTVEAENLNLVFMCNL